MARTGEAHTKLFEENRETGYHLLVDLSPSLFFGTRVAFKSWVAAQLCAHIAWLANAAGEQIGARIASAAHSANIPSSRHREGLNTLFTQLERVCAGTRDRKMTGSVLNDLLGHALQHTASGTTLLLISDLLSLNPTSLNRLRKLTTSHPVSVIWVNDPVEVEAWPSGLYPIEHAGLIQVLDIGKQRHDWLSDLQQQHLEQVAYLTNTLGINVCPISTSGDPHEQLSAWLQL